MAQAQDLAGVCYRVVVEVILSGRMEQAQGQAQGQAQEKAK